MSDPTPPSARELVTAVRRDHQQRWLAGDHVPAEEILRQHPEIMADPELAVEVIYAEFFLRATRGESPTLEEYQRRFPEHADRLRRQVEFFRALEREAPSRDSPSTIDLPPGDAPRSLGQFVLLERLGGGGMGDVFKARQGRLDRVVALKVIRPDLLTNPRVVQRFRQEALAAARLQHPNIVVVHDADEADGTHFLVMEYVEGLDLHKIVERDGPLSAGRACDYVRQAALGLQHAHDKGLVHRDDVKPSNLLLTTDGVVKVLDLGLARLRADGPAVGGDLTHDGGIVGTPDYIAPEQASDSRTVDGRADLYGLGCTMYFLLTGRPPFPDGGLLDKLEKHRSGSPVPLARYRPDLPAEVFAVVSRLMAKKPGDRYQSPAELAAVLAPLAEKLPRTAPTPRRRPSRWPLWSAIGLAALLLLAVAGWRMWPTPGETTDPPPTPELSALDRLNPADIPPEDRFAGQPPELVAVLGGNHGRQWGEITALAASHDGSTLATAGLDGVVRVWRPDGMKEVQTIKLPRDAKLGEVEPRAGVPESLALSADGKRLLTAGGDFALRLWDVTTGEKLLELQEQSSGWLSAVAMSPDGERAVCGTSVGGVYLWELREGRQPKKLDGHGGDVLGVAYSPRGDLVVSTGRDRSVRVWDAKTGKQTTILDDLPDYAECVAFVEEGERVLFGGRDGTVRVWNPRKDKASTVIGRHKGRVTTLAALPKPGLAATTGEDGTVRLWDVAAGKEVGSFPGSSREPRGLVVTGGGSRLFAAGGDCVPRGWDVESGMELFPAVGHTMPVSSLDFSSDGRFLVSGSNDGTARLWDLMTRREQFPAIKHAAAVWDVAFAPDGTRFATAARESRVQTWDAATGKGLQDYPADEEGRPLPKEMRTEPPPGFPPNAFPETRLRGAFGSVAFSPDGRYLVAGSAGIDGTLQLWGTDTDEKVLINTPPPPFSFRVVAFSPVDRRVVTGGESRVVQVWDVGSKNKVYDLPGHTGTVTSVNFTADGQEVLSSSRDGMVRLWQLQPKKETRRFKGHTGGVLGAALFPPRPDGRRLAVSVGRAGEMVLWDLSSDEPVKKWTLPGTIHWVASASDGRHFATGNGNGSVYVFRLTEP